MSSAPSEQYDVETMSNQTQEEPLTLRALVSTKEAGVIIGKGGKNVAELREVTGVKAGVSKVVQGVHDRVLTVSGTLEGVAKAYSLIARTIIENSVQTQQTDGQEQNNHTDTAIATIRLLISHNLMGTVIGRQGAKIKYIQDLSGVRMTASKTLLPQSTERVVEVRGNVQSIEQAMSEIGTCLIEDKDRAYGTILYNPTKAAVNVQNNNFMPPRQHHQQQHHHHPSNVNNTSMEDIRTQHISIPSDMVGCIIGKGGQKISEIRKLSGSHISIAKFPHDDSGERMFTIQGTMGSNEKALFLLYGQLEAEKERRLRGVASMQPTSLEV
ncbi:eukaryotic type KH-domain (KH-domain type I) [Choanephora cucurbitarum]|uniref:RNA-binding protein rnc1 n=1 Tax=Choanephora cucurbitarum TaxID=101091 RepID=A0A1C7NM80_9FUNG|nr:eukaryotic type KH-domain (KH-domain type I) [Choanephora cucurbitarum]OBZ90263.1 RNA-binding protein rnc1 [Choanephora cucurbitarum]